MPARLYRPGQSAPFRLSRSKLELFKSCACCFWLDRIRGIARPSMPPFLINSAIDQILKREFDTFRAQQQPHPWMKQAGVAAVPFSHPDLEDWRQPFTGVRYREPKTNFEIFGGVDDVWQDSKSKELIVVDYKATAKNADITALDPPGGWHDSYRRQLEIYQWILAKDGHPVSSTAYFVYANGCTDQEIFSKKPYKDRRGLLNFRVEIFPHQSADLTWIDQLLPEVKACLESPRPPVRSPNCEHCLYARARVELYRQYRQNPSA